MSNVKILDCTLRDGGYINSWNFGEDNIRSVIRDLTKAGVEIVECGFISEKEKFTKDQSRFGSPAEIVPYLPSYRGDCTYVAMINYGDVDFENFPQCDGGVTGIRVAFHKNDRYDALRACETLSSKGYKVFVQPMVAFSYSDEEYLEMIRLVNGFHPYAFYIVDSHGSMKGDDVSRYYYLVENNLAPDIMMGFHSHNNLQLSYSNAQILVEKQTKRQMIIDSSIFGMGRGAGNLNTELLIEYLNNEKGAKYQIKPILQSVDSTIEPVYRQFGWGFSMPYYLSASYRCHQNYAGYLRQRQTLTVEDMDSIFRCIAPEYKDVFSKKHIEQLYYEYQNCKIADRSAKSALEEKISGRSVVILASGKSVAGSAEEISEIVSRKNAVVISVNYVNELIHSDYVFVSNLRRYEALKDSCVSGLIVTSNIREAENAGYVLNYADLINTEEAVEDNVTLMLINLLIDLKAAEIMLAGVDGYVYGEKNFLRDNLETYEPRDVLEAKNRGMSAMIKKYSAEIPISFITKTSLDI